MDLYTLAPDFQRRDVIDEFASLVWTERYGAAGDVNLVLPATPTAIERLAEGTFLSLRGSKEVMLLETQSIAKGLMTVTGNTLLKFLNERVVRTSADHQDRSWTVINAPAGSAMGIVVSFACIEGNFINDTPDFYKVEGPLNKIPGLSLGPTDGSGGNITAAVPFGPLYDALKTLADTYVMGMSLYLDSATGAGYSLKFTTYLGLDRTSGQTVRDIVRFSPALDSLTNTKELRSISGYKTNAYAFAPTNPVNAGNPSGGPIPSGKASVPGMAGVIGFSRRVLMVFADDLTTETVNGDSAVLAAILAQRAKDALANNNYTKILDGEVVPQSEFQFGTHYGLGDIIELQGQSGLAQKARITEYIRSQDDSGERAYPTVSVID